MDTKKGEIGSEQTYSLLKKLQAANAELARLASIVESSDDAIISKSSDGTIKSWNKGAEHLYGYKAHEILGKPISILIPPNKKDDFPKLMKIMKLGKRIEHYETQRMSKNGNMLDVSLTVSPLKDSQGNIIGISKIARDITRRKREESRLQFLSEASKILSSSFRNRPTAAIKRSPGVRNRQNGY